MKGSHYQSLLDLFNQQNDWDSWEQLFGQSAHFMHSVFQTKVCAVISLPLALTQVAQVRLIWDNNTENKTLGLFAPLLTELQHPEVYKNLVSNDFNWHFPATTETQTVLFLGKSKRQNFFFVVSEGTLKTAEDVEQIFALFSRYLVKSFRHIMKFNHILEMNSLIYIDDVTGLYNQRKLLADLDILIDKIDEENSSFSVFFIDVDHFKLVNDGHGHLVGTKVLREMAHLFKDCFRESDYLYRYGGDEFVAIVPDIDFMQSQLIGERILQQVGAHQFAGDENLDLRISISIGIALYPRDTRDKKDILKMADQMMYQAKAEGRGRVCSVTVE